MSEPATHHSDTCLERLDALKRTDHQAAQHLVRYDWARSHIPPGSRILDCACGPGYGSSILAGTDNTVLGVDTAEEAVNDAQHVYASDRVNFQQADAMTLTPEAIGTFDAIVSIETIEHVAEPQRLLDVFATLLKPEGVLLVSVPNDELFGVDNPYHLWKADYNTVISWLRERFRHVAGALQNHVVGSTVWPIDEAVSSPSTQSARKLGTLRAIDTLTPDTSAGYLFACSDRPITLAGPTQASVIDGFEYVRNLERNARSLWHERNQLALRLKSVEQSGAHQPPTTHSADIQTDSLREQIDALQTQLHSLTAVQHHREEQIDTQAAHITDLTDKLHIRAARADALQRELEQTQAELAASKQQVHSHAAELVGANEQLAKQRAQMNNVQGRLMYRILSKACIIGRVSQSDK